MTRIQAIGPGAVGYLLRGCDPAHPEPGQQPEAGQEPEGEGLERGREKQAEAGIGYFLEGHGEPTGVWLGSGMEGLGLSMRAGDLAREEDLRAIFGELRFPTSERENSTKDHPIYLGAKPRAYQTLAERVDAALKAEPDASVERRREIEVQTARNSKSNVAYYDVTFSPVKSVSVYYAALLAAGDTELALKVRQAHDQAVRIAINSAEADVAWAKTGRHGRASESGRTTGTWEKATGFSGVLFAHHTNRDGEPQLHAHVGIVNRVGLADGRVYAMDGRGFRPVKDAMTAAYDRALEAILSDLAHVVWVERADGKGREIAGIDPELLDEASTRSREHVEPRIAELVEAYRERHGYDPGPQARRKIVDQAVKDTRRPKTGPAGPAAVAAWVDREDGRRERLLDALEDVRDAVRGAGEAGAAPPMGTEYTPGREM
ncbi:MAG: relaxase domain-containing protein, partial [Actinomycetospora chiangmaiensis]|nr:relaxase domain-containing protein [Actinomycetospora chiangmaiensis]